MIRYTAGAIRQIDRLRRHYEAKTRPEAAENLERALDEAESRIERHPESGLPAPRPYPELARPGRVWIKAGRYWIAYSTISPPVILAVFYEQANIPRRVR